MIITASLVLHTQGQPIEGHQGGNVVATFGNAGITLSSIASSGSSSRVSAEAFDALLLMDQLPPTQGRQPSLRHWPWLTP